MTDAKRCESNGCELPAVARVFWLGQPLLEMCQTCADGALKVSEALGCYLHVEPLPGFVAVKIPQEPLTRR